MRTTRGWMLALLALAVMPCVLWAQVRASEPATVSQTIDGTTITLVYFRPRERGRSPIYGKVVTWGEVWTPGANWATTLEVSNNVTVNGHALPKGKYSVWMEVGKKTWAVIFDTTSRRFHMNPPKPDSVPIRFEVTPVNTKGPDVLTWSFPAIGATGATMQFAWAGKAVPLQVTVPPSLPLTVAADIAAPYVGEYAFAWEPDTTKGPPDAEAAKPSSWNISYSKDMLLADWTPPPFDEWSHLVLLSKEGTLFHPGSMVKGELYDVEMDLLIEFIVENGRATGFEVRGVGDELIGRGTRVK